MAQKNNSTESYINMVGDYYKKLPNLSKNWQEIIVQITPWIALVFGVIVTLLSLIKLSQAPFTLFPGSQGGSEGVVALLISLISAILLLSGFPGTKRRQERGWKFIYYSVVVSLIGNIIFFSISGIVLVLIGFYFLYQIRGYYK